MNKLILIAYSLVLTAAWLAPHVNADCQGYPGLHQEYFTGLESEGGKFLSKDNVDNPTGCCEDCSANSECQSWTFLRIPDKSKFKFDLCLQFRTPLNVGGLHQSSIGDAVSGQRNDDYKPYDCSVTFSGRPHSMRDRGPEGNELTHRAIRPDTLEECCTACARMEHCQSWTITDYGGRFMQCYLHDEAIDMEQFEIQTGKRNAWAPEHISGFRPIQQPSPVSDQQETSQKADLASAGAEFATPEVQYSGESARTAPTRTVPFKVTPFPSVGCFRVDTARVAPDAPMLSERRATEALTHVATMPEDVRDSTVWLCSRA